MKQTPPYQGYIDCIELLKYDHNPLAIVYFMSIAGREDKGTQYEWSKGPCKLEITKRRVLDTIQNYHHYYFRDEPSEKLAIFGIAFPLYTRLFQWGMKPSGCESTLYISRWEDTLPTSGIIGCGLENLIIAEETKLWYEAETIEEYYSLPRNPDLKIELKKTDKLKK